MGSGSPTQDFALGAPSQTRSFAFGGAPSRIIPRLGTRAPSPSELVRVFLYRAARELLFNVVKHAQVKEARLRLRRVRNRLRLTISDQGRGFDPQALAAASGFGLLNVRDRAEALGGRLRIRSALGKGSTFLIAVPDAVVARGKEG
jgi:glucose-6-phosphate-specific signal transduction histidine kinase